MAFKVVVEPMALGDIQQAIDYYDEQQIGLGKKFSLVVDKHFQIISKNPFYQIRYHHVRCLPIKNYPFMIHFFITEKTKTAFIVSVYHTSQKPLHVK